MVEGAPLLRAYGSKAHRGFESLPLRQDYVVSLINAPVAQLDRAPGYEPGGREFESLRARQLIKNLSLASQGPLSDIRGRVQYFLAKGCRSRHLAAINRLGRLRARVTQERRGAFQSVLFARALRSQIVEREPLGERRRLTVFAGSRRLSMSLCQIEENPQAV